MYHGRKQRNREHEILFMDLRTWTENAVKNENKKKKAVLAPFMAPTAGGFDDFSESDRNFECTLRTN